MIHRPETVPVNRRLYLVIEPREDGMTGLHVTTIPPPVDAASVVLLVRGMVYEGGSWSAELVSDPSLVAQAGAIQMAQSVAAYAAEHPPASGKSAEMRVSDGKVQWRLEGGAWIDLFTLSSLAGAPGAAGATLIGTAMLERSAGIALTVGDRDFDVAVPGLKKNDSIVVTPLVTTANPNALPAGWSFRGAIAVADNTLRLRMANPLLALNAAYSMSFRVVRLNF